MAPRQTPRQTIAAILFHSNASAGRVYDLVHVVAIVVSVLVTMASSVDGIHAAHGASLAACEWGLTFFFTLDYGLRLYSVSRRLAYAKSFFGLVDLVSILPTYIGIFIPGTRYLSIIRFLRMLRVFRIFNLPLYQNEMQALYAALKTSRRRIAVFIFFLLVCVVVLGSLMYVVEGPENGFTSIPLSIYWSVVTLTTVGYGDISPQTPLGQFLANAIMLLGYSIIVIPTGIVVTSGSGGGRARDSQSCPACGFSGHSPGAAFCCRCAASLPANPQL